LREGRFTAHFSTSEELPDSSGERVEKDGKLLTSRGAGTALDFGLALVEILKSREVSDEISAAVMA
jgi:4-methyl-5(b-hydroxyethyl)-thiazole monophosphate biosynthesis